MRKLQVLTISLLFLITNNIQASLFQAPNPYSFGPEGRTVSDLRNFATPREMISILPNRPVVATDSSGNRLYYTSDGKMSVSIAKDGSMSFSIGGVTKSRNSDGEITGITRTIQGSGGWQEVRNDKDQIISYRALNGDGKVAATYDKDQNLTATYVYTGQGAKLDYVKNEMTQGKTFYDEYGREKYEVDVDGYILKTYQYEDVIYEIDESDASRKTLRAVKTDVGDNQGLLVSTRDYGFDISSVNQGISSATSAYTTTFFERGKPIFVKTPDGLITTEYHYKNDDGANRILDYVIDNLTKTTTFYDKYGNKDYTVNDIGTIITKHYDDCSVNLLSADGASQVTRYDIDGKELYSTLTNISYNSDGTIDKVMNNDNEALKQYYYKEDADGNKIIDYVEDLTDKSKTYYDDEGRPAYTENVDGEIIKDFSWNGNTLVFTFDRRTQLTQWYNMDKELLFESFNERVVSKNIYNAGQLIGKWNAQNNELTILINERAWITVALREVPTADTIRSVIANSAAIKEEIANNGDGSVLDGILEKYGCLLKK